MRPIPPQHEQVARSRDCLAATVQPQPFSRDPLGERGSAEHRLELRGEKRRGRGSGGRPRPQDGHEPAWRKMTAGGAAVAREDPYSHVREQTPRRGGAEPQSYTRQNKPNHAMSDLLGSTIDDLVSGRRSRTPPGGRLASPGGPGSGSAEVGMARKAKPAETKPNTRCLTSWHRQQTTTSRDGDRCAPPGARSLACGPGRGGLGDWAVRGSVQQQSRPGRRRRGPHSIAGASGW